VCVSCNRVLIESGTSHAQNRSHKIMTMFMSGCDVYPFIFNHIMC